MRQADFRAQIKKIEIANKTLADSWSQTIRIILDEIELTDENLLELKQFRPNEPISVVITPVQVSLTDCTTDKKHLALVKPGNAIDDEEEQDDGYAFELVEGDLPEPAPGMVAKEWKF